MNILGVRVDNFSIQKLMNDLLVKMEKRQGAHIVTVNPEFVVEAAKNIEFKNVLNKSDYSLIDGIGILVGLRYLSENKGNAPLGSFAKIKALIKFYLIYFKISFLGEKVIVDKCEVKRVSGVDFIFQIVQQDWMKGRKVYLLGGADNVSSLASSRLRRINPDIVFRSSSGHRDIREFLSVNENSEENIKIVADISNFSPDLLLVAYGHPFQDLWIEKFRSSIPNTIAVGVGGSFDYIAGKIPRAPEWMRAIGLEWFYRLVKQPKRYKRTIDATWSFANLVVAKSLS